MVEKPGAGLMARAPCGKMRRSWWSGIHPSTDRNRLMSGASPPPPRRIAIMSALLFCCFVGNAFMSCGFVKRCELHRYHHVGGWRR